MLYILHQYRGLAAILVVLFHIQSSYLSNNKHTSFTEFFNLGGVIGVSFFFALSGFIIFFKHSHQINQPNNSLSFVVKRISRIYPVYIILTLSILPAWFFFGERSINDILVWKKILGSLFLLPQTEYPLVVAWSLSYEMLFYSLFAITIFNRLLGFSLLALWFMLIIEVSPNNDSFMLDFFSHKISLLFFLGMSCALLSLRFRVNFVIGLILLCVGSSGLVYIMHEQSNQTSFSSLLFFGQLSIYISCLLLAANNDKLNQLSCNNKTLNLIGDASYSIYLIHFPVIAVLNKVLAKVEISHYLSSNLQFLSIAIVCLIAGIITHKVIEKPLTHYTKTVLLHKLA